MKLSIIVPFYNAEEYLEECLNSLIIDNENIEFLLINDGSTDNSLNICQKYKQENVKIFNNINKGVSYSRNFGINNATGEWIMFVDSDDLLANDWNITLQKYYSRGEDIIFFSNNLEKKNTDKKIIIQQCIGFIKNNYSFSSPWSKLYKREFLIKNKIYFNEEIINGEDMLFNCYCIIAAKKILASKEKIYRYRINSTSSTKKWNEKYILSDLEFRNKLYSKLKQTKLYTLNEINEIEKFIDTNAKIGILQRLAYSNDYTFFKKNIKKLKQYDFKINFKQNVKKSIILLLYDLKLYRLIYILLNLKSKGLKHRKFYIVDI